MTEVTCKITVQYQYYFQLSEKCLKNNISHRLLHYLENRRILTDYQHGFSPKHSTASATLHLANHVYESLEDKENVLGMFLNIF